MLGGGRHFRHRRADAGGSCLMRILLADDNAIEQAAVVPFLEKAGHKVDTAENGRDAVDAVRYMHYDLVLMDVQMPGMDGLEASKAIRDLRGRKAGIPIIALTGSVLSGIAERCFAAGMNDFLAKPVTPGALLDAIERCGRTSDAFSGRAGTLRARPGFEYGHTPGPHELSV